ncbi:UNVERIFIED_CONTAM: hypothetical protein K2H54_055398 [Gekko kuhli]
MQFLHYLHIKGQGRADAKRLLTEPVAGVRCKLWTSFSVAQFLRHYYTIGLQTTPGQRCRGSVYLAPKSPLDNRGSFQYRQSLVCWGCCVYLLPEIKSAVFISTKALLCAPQSSPAAVPGRLFTSLPVPSLPSLVPLPPIILAYKLIRAEICHLCLCRVPCALMALYE